jgi:hypothetical protein
MPALRWAARLLGGAVCFAFALSALAIGATQVAAATEMDRREWLVIYVVLALSVLAAWLGVWTLGGRNPLGRRPERVWTQRPRRLLLARVSLGWAVLMGGYLLSAVLCPPPSGDRATAGLLAAVIVAASYAAVTVARERGGRGRTLAMWLGAWAGVMLVLAAFRIPDTPMRNPGPALALSLIVAGSMWGAVAIAGLLVWSVRGAWHPPESRTRLSPDLAEPCGES